MSLKTYMLTIILVFSICLLSNKSRNFLNFGQKIFLKKKFLLRWTNVTVLYIFRDPNGGLPKLLGKYQWLIQLKL